MIEVIADSVSVEFPIYDANARSLRNTVLSMGSGGRIQANARDRVVVKALEEVSFSLREGDRLGLIGANGAGKSTLLRTLAGIYEPTRGRVVTRGRVAPLFDISIGMDADATGYENIRIRGLFLEMSPEEIDARTPEIAEFSELGPYLAMPIRTYSSGMRVRLAFAIATALEPDILLMDEMIGAGDAAFIDRASARLQQFLSRTRIMVLASHSNDIIRRMCNKALLLHQGKIVGFDAVDEVLEAYRSMIAR
jgi:ABC-2 type transport system ATP-binding protein/lipopolysaccharide transport system ATP-binding protein